MKSDIWNINKFVDVFQLLTSDNKNEHCVKKCVRVCLHLFSVSLNIHLEERRFDKKINNIL